eukprot:Tbor_TRINITY_DN5648_c1_g7::TRINITY_DN5648_c1_g7_i2::g.8704::m.8704
MRGNRYARNFDVTKTRKERKKKYRDAIANTNRVKRLKSRLGKIKERKDKRSNTSHTSALMESYILRRKEERKKEKAQKLEEERACGGDTNGSLEEYVMDSENRGSKSTANKTKNTRPAEPVSEFRLQNGYASEDEEDSSSHDDSDSDDSSIDLSALEGVVVRGGGSLGSNVGGSKKRDKFGNKKGPCLNKGINKKPRRLL